MKLMTVVMAALILARVPASAGELAPSELKGFRRAVKNHVQEQLDEEDGAFVVRDEKLDFLVNRAGSGWVVRQASVHAVGGKPRVAQAAAAPPLKKPDAGGAVFICTMGDYSGPRTPDGRCPKCGMNLIEKK